MNTRTRFLAHVAIFVVLTGCLAFGAEPNARNWSLRCVLTESGVEFLLLNRSGLSRFVEVFVDGPQYVLEYDCDDGFGLSSNGATLGLEKSALRLVRGGSGGLMTDASLLQWNVAIGKKGLRVLNARVRIRSLTLEEIRQTTSIDALERRLLESEVTVEAEDQLPEADSTTSGLAP
jgi:hypothetical protein